MKLLNNLTTIKQNSHLYNRRGGWYKQEGAKVPELINEKEGINEDGGIF